MTSSTESRRGASSSACGTPSGTLASASVRLARTIRCEIVGSATRNARAISDVVRPPNSLSVNAARASVDRTGWHVANSRLSRSSPIWSSSSASRSGSDSERSSSDASCSRLRSASRARRSRSIARCLAVAISHAPGLSGIPDWGHCSSAATSASWARSSASPTSRTIRTRPPISRADSIRQTASIVRVTSGELTVASGGVELGHLVHAPHLDHVSVGGGAA